jgi:hypothetical protein
MQLNIHLHIRPLRFQRDKGYMRSDRSANQPSYDAYDCHTMLLVAIGSRVVGGLSQDRDI